MFPLLKSPLRPHAHCKPANHCLPLLKALCQLWVPPSSLFNNHTKPSYIPSSKTLNLFIMQGVISRCITSRSRKCRCVVLKITGLTCDLRSVVGVVVTRSPGLLVTKFSEYSSLRRYWTIVPVVYGALMAWRDVSHGATFREGRT
jgi:hypothetical protein